MDGLQLKLCDIQGRLFVLSGEKHLPSAAFIRAFMTSDAAKGLDSRYNRMQWMGEEYLLEEIMSTKGEDLSGAGDVFAKDVLYWIGYVYRFWHYCTGEPSSKILRQAPVMTMKRNYFMFHTMDPALAVEKLKEIASQRKKVGLCPTRRKPRLAPVLSQGSLHTLPARTDIVRQSTNNR